MYKHSKRPPRGGYQLSGPKPSTGNEPYSTISNGPSLYEREGRENYKASLKPLPKPKKQAKKPKPKKDGTEIKLTIKHLGIRRRYITGN